MLDGGVSRRYARALFETAKEHGLIDTIEADLNRVVETISQQDVVRSLWYSRSIQPSERKALIDTAFREAGIHQYVINLLKIMIDKGREESIVPLAREFAGLIDEFRGVIDVDLETSRDLGTELLEKIRRQLEVNLNRKIRLKVRVHPELIGGISVRIGDKVIDGSIAKRLYLLRQSMAGNNR